MSELLDAAAAEALGRSLILGVARQPMPLGAAFHGTIASDDPKGILKALALLGQRSRFRRPAIVSLETEAATPLDPRPILPAAARAPLLSLLIGKAGRSDDAVALAIADRLAARGLRLHPFDLPRLDAYVKAQAETLGPSAIAWAERHTAAGPDRGIATFLDAVDETTWMRGRPAPRASFIRALRRHDPARARVLVEKAFAGDVAATRVAMLDALGERLSVDDAAFLLGVAKDRAPSVRAAAERLLQRLPGSDASARRLADCLGRLKAGRKGLLRRRTVLELDLPVNVKPQQAPEWAHQAFAGLSLDALAGGLGLTADELVEAAGESPLLNGVFAVLASADRRYALVERFVRGGAETAWQAMIDGDGMGFADEAEAEAWSAAALQPTSWDEMPGPIWLTRLYAALRCPLPAPTWHSLLACNAWRGWTESLRSGDRSQGGEGIAAIAALTPPSLRPQLRGALAPLPPELAIRPLAALALFDLIDAA